MKKILITGGHGFLGRNLAAHIRARGDCVVIVIGHESSAEDLRRGLAQADIIFHLAGVNRPQHASEYDAGNAGSTEILCGMLREANRAPKIVFSSSIQAALDNPYGASKAHAEQILRRFAAATGALVRIYRLKNLFGKWCRPNYNSVTATFCHNIARDLPIFVSNPDCKVDLSYVDDVVALFLTEIDDTIENHEEYGPEVASYSICLGDLVGRIQIFHEMKSTLRLPDFTDAFNRALYSTYLSYVPEENCEYKLNIKSDPRGSLAEFMKSDFFGQIFVSRTRPGITRGNHYHHTKTEKFLVLEGEGIIRTRLIDGTRIFEYRVSGASYQVVDIPPGLTHSITNVGNEDMVTLFWSSEVFDPDRTDTYFLPVDAPSDSARQHIPEKQ
jgi:UDP-2-acetamido-2,6-beta-L-arabino-hexul-4-ose reductase